MALTRTVGLNPMSPKRRAELAEQGVAFPVSTLVARRPFASRTRVDQVRVKHRPANEFPAAVVNLALERDLFSCARCGRGVGPGRGLYWSAQHRRARMGIQLPDTNSAANCIVLCGSATSPHCHFEVERRLEVERVNGFWFRQLTDGKPTDPTAVPVKHAAHGWVLLDNEGGWTATSAPEEAA